MHPYEIPAAVKERVVNRMGRLTVNETIDASRCAFIVIDMQTYFCAEGFPAEVPMARTIVPNLNRLAEASEGFKMLPALDVRSDDLRLKKVKYSAFIEVSSGIDAALKTRNVDTVLIAGTMTNVCCESSARDAMMLGYEAALISDCNASLTDEEHGAALSTFMML